MQTCNDDVIEYPEDVTELAALIHRWTFSVAEGRRGRANLGRALQIRTNNRNKWCTGVWANVRNVYRIVGGTQREAEWQGQPSKLKLETRRHNKIQI
jgi:hypothetical protein